MIAPFTHYVCHDCQCRMDLVDDVCVCPPCGKRYVLCPAHAQSAKPTPVCLLCRNTDLVEELTP